MAYKTRRQAKFRSRNDYNNQRQSPKAYPRSVSFAKRYPRYRAINSSRGIYQFRRTTQQTFLMNQSSGFNGTGKDMTVAICLAHADIVVAGSIQYQPVIPNVSEFTNLFDQYRIKRVTIEMVYGSNNVDTPTSTYCIPAFHVANDYNSIGSFTDTDMFQYPDMKTYQPSAGQSKIVWSFTPRARADALTDTLITSSSAMNVPSPWLDTSSSTINHLGCRIFMNNMGVATNNVIGQMLMLIHVDLEFKFVK